VAVETMNFPADLDFEQPTPTSHVNVGRAERWLSMAAGGALAAYAARRRDVPGGIAAVAGAALLYRGSTGHCLINAAIGRDSAHRSGEAAIADFESDTRDRLRGPRGIHVEESITINKPVGEIYRFWRNLENLPQFMEHLESVSARDGGVSHWVAKGPAGMKVEWDARIINEVENRVIAWQSLEGSTVATAGSVTFTESPRGTELRVHFQYDPPGGKLGAVVARLLGEEPNQTVREDLRRLKRVLETGEVPTIQGQPSGRGRHRGW
jgi:uncharacterized membrane protein